MRTLTSLIVAVAIFLASVLPPTPVLAASDLCDPTVTDSAPIIVSGALRTQLIAETSGQAIFICSFDWGSAGTTTIQLVYGTTTTNPCDTGAGNLTGAYSEIAQTGRVVYPNGAMKTPVSQKVCMVRSVDVAVAGSIQYRKVAP